MNDPEPQQVGANGASSSSDTPPLPPPSQAPVKPESDASASLSLPIDARASDPQLPLASAQDGRPGSSSDGDDQPSPPTSARTKDLRFAAEPSESSNRQSTPGPQRTTRFSNDTAVTAHLDTQGSQLSIDSLMFSYGIDTTGDDDDPIAHSSMHMIAESTFRGRRCGSVRLMCFHVSQSTLFQIFFATVIFVNVVLMALEADIEAKNVVTPGVADENREFLDALSTAEVIFTTAFVVELSVTLCGYPFNPLKDGWIVSDVFIVSSAVLDSWIITPLSGNARGSSLSFLTSFRVLRVLRVLRVFRLIRFMRPLRLLAEALGEAFMTIFWMVLFVPLTAYSFGVVFTSTIGTLPDMDPAELAVLEAEIADFVPPREYFDSVTTSMITLGTVLLQGIRWGPRILRPLLLSGDWRHVSAGVMLLMFIIFGLVCLGNLISGVFVSALFNAAKRDAAVIDRESLSQGDLSMKKLKAAFKQMDVNCDNVLSWNEFKQGLVSNAQLCKDLKIDLQQADALYRSLDIHDKGGVSIDDYFIGLIKMTRTSKTIDMLSIDYQQQKTFRDLSSLSQAYRNDVDQIQSFVKQLDEAFTTLTEEVKVLADEVAQVQHVNGTSPGLASSDDICGAPAKDPELEAAESLEEKFGFKRRLDALEASLQETIAAGNSGGEHPSSSDFPAGAGVPEAPHGTEAMWRELLDEEVMPWLHRALADIAAKSAA